MLFSRTLKKLGLRLQKMYLSAHSLYKVREAGMKFREPLSFPERIAFLELRPLLEGSGLVIYDIGASIGILSGFFAKLPNVIEVHAFEPISNSFAQLSTRLKQYPWAFCHKVALGEANKDLTMTVFDDLTDSSSLLNMLDTHTKEFPAPYSCHEETVQEVRLDDYVRDHKLLQPHVVKIDVQGYEDRVLRGGRQTIGQAQYCVLEMSFEPLYEGSPLFDDIYRMMREMDFALVGIGEVLKGRSGRPLFVNGFFGKLGLKPLAARGETA